MADVSLTRNCYCITLSLGKEKKSLIKDLPFPSLVSLPAQNVENPEEEEEGFQTWDGLGWARGKGALDSH